MSKKQIAIIFVFLFGLVPVFFVTYNPSMKLGALGLIIGNLSFLSPIIILAYLIQDFFAHKK